MSWIGEHKRSWRVFFLVLLLVALSGPWALDRINVPSPHSCAVRLDEDFCGTPLSITWGFLTGEFTRMATRLGRGTADSQELLVLLIVLLAVLPFLSNLALILRGEYRRWRALHLVILGLAAGAALLWWLRLPAFSRLHPALWGVWLYIGLAAGALVLELRALVASRRSVHE